MAYTSKYTGEQIDALLDVVETTPPSGGSGGGSSVRYFNIVPVVTAVGDMIGSLLRNFPGLIAIKFPAVDNSFQMIKPAAGVDSSYYPSVSHAAILSGFRGFVDESNDLNSDLTIEQFIQMGAIEVTEEEFYTL